MTTLIKRTYRISKDHEKKVKALKKKTKFSESHIIRTAIDQMV